MSLLWTFGCSDSRLGSRTTVVAVLLLCDHIVHHPSNTCVQPTAQCRDVVFRLMILTGTMMISVNAAVDRLLLD